MSKSKRGNSKFLRFFGPLLDALRELGGSGTPAEVTRVIAKNLSISDDEQSEELKSGVSRFSNQVAWARNYLKYEGYIDSSRRGVWVLTERGWNKHLSPEEARAIFLKWVDYFKEKRAGRTSEPSTVTSSRLPQDESDAEGDADEVFPNHREILLSILKTMPSSGFEKLCQRLLRESGFTEVEVTGRSGDEGIDGWGILEINPLVSIKVLFQCKRYAGSVGPDKIRDLRGALMGRADKGILLTTGTFTSSARSEASRDGAAPIELVDGDKLLDLFERLELGLKPKTIYEVDSYFFKQFQ